MELADLPRALGEVGPHDCLLRELSVRLTGGGDPYRVSANVVGPGSFILKFLENFS
ncbi:hypothetical protein I6F35_20380 [Bradyrhizobium sp. BRP22]|uniref:hypothetical protein n=1 Tax=Bradyrhizobium sp. BRP22 TaxID=2793821 RepID=UPI001CD782AD|nr:hypothetical protein [Bradyrhizobium sp. BRP22]MCA1455536.1 hypothetical protein [Bradyrhizobium sp. BRP22]